MLILFAAIRLAPLVDRSVRLSHGCPQYVSRFEYPRRAPFRAIVVAMAAGSLRHHPRDNGSPAAGRICFGMIEWLVD